MSNHGPRDGDERLADWVDGRLSARDLERFEAELRVNKELRTRADAYRRTVESVQQALRAPLPRIDVADAVLAQIAATRGVSAPLRATPWHGASRRAMWFSGSVAAALLVGLVLLFQWRPAPETSELAQAPMAPEAAGSAAPDAGLEDFAAVDRRRDGDANEPAGEVPLQDKGAALPEEVRREGQQSADDETVALRRLAGGEGKAEKSDLDGFMLGFVDGQPGERDQADLPKLTVAATTVPQVLLRRRADAGLPTPDVQTAATGAIAVVGMHDFFVAETDLGAAFPAGTLQLQRLLAPPADRATAVGEAKDAYQVPVGGEAWLIEGDGPEVFRYLAQLSAAGYSCGFEVVSGEVPTSEVLALLPAATEEPLASQVAKEVESAKSKARAPEGRAEVRAGLERQSTRGAPADVVPPAEPSAGPPVGGTHLGAAAGPGSGSPQPAPSPAPETSRARVVIVIDRAQVRPATRR